MNELIKELSRSDVVGTVVSFKQKQAVGIFCYDIHSLVAGK